MIPAQTPTHRKKPPVCSHTPTGLPGDTNRFFQVTLRDMLSTPCAEICLELGAYFEEAEDYEEASLWYYNAAHETSSILDVHTGGDLPASGIDPLL